jgi:hypothetical protein
MSVMAASDTQGDLRARRDGNVIRAVLAAAVRQRGLFLSIALGFPLLFYVALLGLLMARFGNMPNYLVPHDWVGNVSRIVASTGSVSDMLPIILNEWLLEIGYMNYAYGHGVSEWSLLIIPHKLAMVTAVGALIGLNFALIAEQRPAGALSRQYVQTMRCGLLTSVGAVCASLTGITLFWVVCHASPSWVVSLAILGVEVSTTLALEPIGPAVSLAGTAMLVLSALLIIRDDRAAADPVRSRPAKEITQC